VLPGTTDALQSHYPEIYLFHSPEFLVAKNAAHDARNPERNIIGYTQKSKEKAEDVLSVLPEATYTKVMAARSAELVKYMGNVFLAQKVIYANLMHDLSQEIGAAYEDVRDAVSADPRITPSHLAVSHDGGRGAGGYCFIKDLAALVRFYHAKMPADTFGKDVLASLERKNVELLKNSGKDADLLRGVYGDYEGAHELSRATMLTA
jgi:UDP-glucose 6-dehydrogenase